MHKNKDIPSVSPAQDDNLEVASTKLPKTLSDLVNKSKNWKVSENEEQYVFGNKTVTRVTSNSGPINRLRATPFTLTQEERARRKGEKRWGDTDPSTKLQTNIGEFNMEDYIAEEHKRMKQYTLRGTIMHKYMQLFATPSSQNTEDLEREIQNDLAEAGLRSGSFR